MCSSDQTPIKNKDATPLFPAWHFSLIVSSWKKLLSFRPNIKVHELLSFWLVFLFLSGCGNFPKDPENTLKKVQNGVLMVGYSENPPWVVETDSIPTGIEPELIKDFAKSLNADIEWVKDTEQNLIDELKKKEVHLVVAGITSDSPRKKEVALTRPFIKHNKKKQVMAAIQGENAFVVQLERFLFRREKELSPP